MSTATDASALFAIAFLLGMRHGFDADHLATVDGFTRLSLRRGDRFARWCGTLFSLGHGLVVVVIAGLVASASQQWAPPAWFEGFGSVVSIVFLFALGVANLRAVLQAAPGQVVAPVGIKGHWPVRLAAARGPWGIAGVGALFALSFDTLSQTALLAATAAQGGGVERAICMGFLFTAGMVLTDGLNGWWMGRLIAATDQAAAIASKVMGCVVAGVSLLAAGLGLARWLLPAFGDWAEGKELYFGGTVVLIMALGYGLALWLARRQPQVQLQAEAATRIPL